MSRVEFIKSKLDLCKKDVAEFCRIFLNYEPNDYNIPFLRSKEKQLIYRAGRQSGKSKSLSAKALHCAVYAYDYGGIPEGETEALIIIASIKLDQAKLILREMKNLISAGDVIKHYLINATKSYIDIHWANGKGHTIIECVALGDATLKGSGTRGYSTILIIVDEFAHITNTEALFALYGGGAARNSSIYIASTPAGSQGRFFNICTNSRIVGRAIDDKHSKKEKTDWVQFNAKSAWNPYVSKEFLEKRKAEMSDALFRQEYLGEFIGVGSYMIPRHLISEAITNQLSHTNYPIYTLGVDIAGTGDDSTVFTLGRFDGKNGYSLIRSEFHNNIDTIKIVDIMAEYKNELGANLQKIVLEKNGVGKGVYDYALHKNIAVEGLDMTRKSKADMYVGLLNLFEKKKIYLNNIGYSDRLYIELQEVKREFNANEQLIIKHGDDDSHNDFVSSFILSCYPAMTLGSFTTIDIGNVFGHEPEHDINLYRLKF